MKKLTQAEFDAMIRDERGYINIPDETDCTGVNFHSIDTIAFGVRCKLGDGCTLGDCCTLRDGCTLGDDCTLGYYCTLGYRCKLGDDCTLGYGCTLMLDANNEMRVLSAKAAQHAS